MSFDRRLFLRSAALAACSLSELTALAAKQKVTNNGKVVSEEDEHYWDNVRQLFPLTTSKSYLNNGTMGPSPYPVIEATHKGMMLSDEFGEYRHTGTLLKRIAKFIGANKDEIAYTNNVTHGINIASRGLPLQKGDEVIMTTHEHVGNAIPWLNRMKQDGIVIKTFTPASTAAATYKKVEALISDKTRVIAIPHIPCTQGQVMPVKEISKLARGKGIYSCIDGAHAPGMIPVNVKDIGCDIYLSCGHKWLLGPKGTGFMYVRKEVQDDLKPLFAAEYTANWELSENKVFMSDYLDGADKYFGGTQNSGLIDGLIAAMDFMDTIGMDNIHRRIKYLGSYTQQQLSALVGKVELLTPTEERSYCGINSFKLTNRDTKKFYNTCNKAGLRLRFVPESDLDCIRISTHIYNSKSDIDKLVTHIKSFA